MRNVRRTDGYNLPSMCSLYGLGARRHNEAVSNGYLSCYVSQKSPRNVWGSNMGREIDQGTLGFLVTLICPTCQLLLITIICGRFLPRHS